MQHLRLHQSKILSLLATFTLVIVTSLYFLQGSELEGVAKIDALIWIIGVLAFGRLLKKLTPSYAHIVLLILMLAWLIAGVGLVQATTVTLWLLSSWSIGRILLSLAHRRPLNIIFSITEPLLIGMAFWLALWGTMLHFPINYRNIYLGLILLPPVLLLHIETPTLKKKYYDYLNALQTWIQAIPLWAWTFGLAIISWIFRWAAIPSVSYDDQALHLRLWTELVTRHQASFDFQDQIWSVAPFAVDLLHAGLSLIAGADARGAMNLALALILLTLTSRILHLLNVHRTIQWMLLILMATTPMLGSLLLSLQTELFLSLLGLAGVRFFIESRKTLPGEYLLGILACAALSVATKLPGGVLGLSLLLAFALSIKLRGNLILAQLHCLRWPTTLIFFLLLFVALHSYALSWLYTGNPVFPLYNKIFRSPFLPYENFADQRWIHGFTLINYVRAFFETSMFLESRNYVAGWQYLILLPLAIVAVWRRKSPLGLRLVLLPMLGFGITMFAATQYWRYLFPVMPIANVLLVALFMSSCHIWRKTVIGCTVLCASLNFALFPGVSWMMRHSSSQIAYTETGKEQLMKKFAPVAELTTQINHIAPGSRVLYPENTPFGAMLHGIPLYVNWYAPQRAARFQSINDENSMVRFLAQEKVDYVIINNQGIDANNIPGILLRHHLSRSGIAISQADTFTLYRLTSTRLYYRKILELTSGNPPPNREYGPPPINGFEPIITNQAHLLASTPTLGLAQARYNVRISCATESGYFIAHIDWGNGQSYNRQIACRSPAQSYSEAIPIPSGTTNAKIYGQTRGTPTAMLENLSFEVY